MGKEEEEKVRNERTGKDGDGDIVEEENQIEQKVRGEEQGEEMEHQMRDNGDGKKNITGKEEDEEKCNIENVIASP